jgi:hypothetical protein
MLMIYMWFTGINYYKLAVEKDRDSHRRTGREGRGGSCPPQKDYKVGQMFNISRAKSGKLKKQKAKKPPVCWANKGSRAIFASQSGNIGLL